jgi:hypothetical protein
MAEPQSDRRATRRFALTLPVTLDNGHDAPATTRDVSARGVCFYIESALSEGQQFEFTLTLPPEVTLTENVEVRCVARVVRVEPANADGKLAVAAVIDRYEFLPREAHEPE